MKRVIGIGGIFFKAKDPKNLAAWYEKHFGIGFNGQTYVDFPFQEKEKGSNVFSFFKADTDYFSPSEKEFMLNLRVDDLDALLEVLKTEGVELAGEPQSYDYGKFGWVVDPEGNKIELWEPLES